MASWLVRSSPDCTVCVGALAEDSVVFLGKTLYSHSASLHLGVLMVPANFRLGQEPITWQEVTQPVMDLVQGGVEILLIASCYRNRRQARSDKPLGLYADCTYYSVKSTPTT